MKNINTILRNPDATDATGAEANPVPAAPAVTVPAQPKRKGRPPGSVTLVNVKLSELTAKFNDPNQLVPVGKKFIESLKLTVTQAAPVAAAAATEAAKPEPTVALTAGE